MSMISINRENLRHFREVKRLSPQALADEVSRILKSNMHVTTIHKLEAGQWKKSRQRTVQGIADALGISVQELTGPTIKRGSAKSTSGLNRGQMNIRLNGHTRNALQLVALRYGVKRSTIIEIAPFLFLWLAEASLKKRAEELDDFEDQWQQRLEMQLPEHLNDDYVDRTKYLYETEQEGVIAAERASIAELDIFGDKLPANAKQPKWEKDGALNPIARFCRSLADELGGLATFRSWESNDPALYWLGLHEAMKLTGGHKEAAELILQGTVPLHELTKSDVYERGSEARAQWILERLPRPDEPIDWDDDLSLAVENLKEVLEEDQDERALIDSFKRERGNA